MRPSPAHPLAVGLHPPRAAIAVLAVLGLLASALPGGADAQDVERLQAGADQARSQAQALAGQIAAQTSALSTRTEEAEAAGARERELAQSLQAGRAREGELAAAVARARSELRAARAELERATGALARRLIAIYKNGSADALALLLSADGYRQLNGTVEYLDRIRTADEGLIERARALQLEVDARLLELSEARERQRTENEQLASAREQAAAIRAAAAERAAALSASRAARLAALDQLRVEIDRWEQRVQRAERISAAAAEQQVAEQIGEWAIPDQIVMCESGGDFGALNPSSGAGGAYQILPSTWRQYGGKGLPHEASPAEQARIAALIWADSGGSAWECAG